MKNTIYSNYYSSEAEDEAREFLFTEYNEDNKWKTLDDIPDNEVFEELSFEDEANWDDAKEQLESFFDGHGYFLLQGTCGRWNGQRRGGYIFNSFKELANAWQDCDYIEIYDENGHFNIKCSHHDGDNYYEVKRLSYRGYDYADNHYSESDEVIHDKLWNSNFYTSLPHFTHVVYGCKKG